MAIPKIYKHGIEITKPWSTEMYAYNDNIREYMIDEIKICINMLDNEDTANNLLVEVRSNPNDDSYLTTTYTFNAGNNDSVALFMRGIGGNTSGNFNYNSGDEEIRLDSVTITAN